MYINVIIIFILLLVGYTTTCSTTILLGRGEGRSSCALRNTVSPPTILSGMAENTATGTFTRTLTIRTKRFTRI